MLNQDSLLFGRQEMKQFLNHILLNFNISLEVEVDEFGKTGIYENRGVFSDNSKVNIAQLILETFLALTGSSKLRILTKKGDLICVLVFEAIDKNCVAWVETHNNIYEELIGKAKQLQVVS